MKKTLLVLGLLAGIGGLPATAAAQSGNSTMPNYQQKSLDSLDQQSDEARLKNRKKAEAYVKREYARAQRFGRYVVTYDRCVAAGNIPPSKISGETKYKAFVEKESQRPDPLRTENVTDKMIADSMRKSLEDMKAKLQPVKAGTNNYCLMVSKTWPMLLKKFGVADEQ